ncbi:MAG: hypothetical protein HGB03_02995 [Candidatus Yonathbacteria bacterium]|nr:hypothetical protein [Candidatus Yonathbacteria bacterium]NTW47399.1 hypothetical protein [Candidatus Yonathbacteria bacterium]
MKKDPEKNGYLAFAIGKNREMCNVVIQTSLHISPEVLRITLRGKNIFSVPGISVYSYIDKSLPWYFEGTFIELSDTFYQRRHILSLGESPGKSILRWYPPPEWTVVAMAERLNNMMLPDMLNAHAPGMAKIAERVESLTMTRPIILGYV